MPVPTDLPIRKIHVDILRILQAGHRMVLVAPTGSGKTTQVPQMLLDGGITGGKMIVVLQPRRVAARTVPELEFAPFDEAALTACLARAFTSLSLVKDAQAAPLYSAFHHHLEKGQISWLDELVPLSLLWPGNPALKISYTGGEPEAQVKLQECFALKAHPTLCEGRLPILLTLCTPDGKRLATTPDWPTFLTREWPKHRAAVAEIPRPPVALTKPGVLRQRR